MKKKAVLSKSEQEMEASLARGEWKQVSPRRLAEAKEEFAEIKTERVNARFRATDIALLKMKAEREGMPYQTLLGSVIHKFVTGQLVDVDSVKVVVSQMKKK